MRLFLVVQNEGKQKGMRIPVPGEIFVVGRDPECQLRPASSIISKKHCAFINQGNEYFLEDYKSTNGTILNDQRIEGKVALKSGDNVAIGPLEFSILLEAKPGDPKSGVIKAMAPPAAAVAQAAAKTAATAPAAAAKPAPSPNQAPAPKPVAKPQAAPATAAVPPVSATAPTEVMPAATAAAPTASASKNALDDDIAALLLGGDESSSGAPEVTGEGTTVVDLSKDLSATPPSGNPAIRPATAGKPISSTTDAAKALLEKYMRRPRVS